MKAAPALAVASAGQRRRAAVPAAAVALGCAAAAAWLALHHPLLPGTALALALAWGALSFAFPTAWLALLPALLPAASLAPWTGWVGLDEFDLLLLATVAGVQARQAARPQQAPPLPAGVRLLAAALGGWTLLALSRGLLDAGGLPGWFDAYLEPLNAWRVAKPALWALLLLPALHRVLQADATGALWRLRSGMLAGTALFVAAVLWERAAHVGLLNFTGSYRTTALFWDMHVGGAAIDAYVALALPFCVWALWRLRRPLPWCVAALLATGTLYAALTTYSRGVYGAVGLPLLLPLAWLMAWRVRHGTLRGMLLAGGLTLAAALPLTWAARTLDALGVGLLLGLWLLAALAAWRFTRIGWRAAAGVTLAVALLAEVVTVFGSGGSFMRERVEASGMDLRARIEHWQRGLALLDAPAGLLLGLGTGRLPAHYGAAPGYPGFSGQVRLQPGGVRLDGHALGVPGPSALYGLTQRVAPHPGPHRLDLRLSAQAPAWLLVKVCQAWLLYDDRCQQSFVRVPAGPRPAWLTVTLKGKPLDAAAVLPRPHVLTVAALDGTVLLEQAQLHASGEQLLANGGFDAGLAHWWPRAQGHFVPWHIDNLYLELLIERGLPGLALFLALAAGALWRLACRVRARDEVAEAAVFLASALCGALLVGLISSVMDMPRVAWLLWLLPWVAWLLPRPARA
ncbi:hypothetical protein [Azohydromonas aeria]|uniref:hypothetical protein n=1 Tax=Azohydromonas aeria TaxID=2590212 RepID=UPI0012F8E35C|nr:hypothetical protein [Azohydromonas aeria]